MALIDINDLSWGFAAPPLLENIGFRIEKGERIGLLGRNGAGKSTLLKLISGEIRPDLGEIRRQQGITISFLDQEVPAGCEATVFEMVAGGFGDQGNALAEYNRICRGIEAGNARPTERRDELQLLLDAGGGWELLPKIENVLSRTGLDPEEKFGVLSAGLKRRVLFARAVVKDPDLLLLDEPTNHLDIDSIQWMEDFILRNAGTLLFVTHDRFFLKRLAGRILELDRGRLASYDCDYETYLSRRQAVLEAEEKQSREFEKKLSREEAWLRQGVKARRTRNEGRVRALKKLREARRALRGKIGNVRLQVQEAERTGKLVIEAQGVGFSAGEVAVVRNFSTVVLRGDKVGIIGPNGVGKTTLLRLLLKEILPDTGTVRHGMRFQEAYFDQLRGGLDEQKTVRENIGEGNDFIVFNGEKRHVISYLQDFLFSPERCRTPVHVLSGGEKNRLMLAKLFQRPANVLVLDEPTNDLDIETLELLEELLFDYQGTLLLVSHDRAFLNNVVTSTLAFEGKGQVIEYAGGYDDWLIQRPQQEQSGRTGKESSPQKKQNAGDRENRKLTFREMQELKELPGRIESLEAEQRNLYNKMSDPLFYRNAKEEIGGIKKRLDEVELAIKEAYLRWEKLDAI
ncbi:MAG: ATP-binding cassette domain-containing protein [Desulfobacteraceae bacterium]|nr:MAG: ATP-binding cassette domain-containing protein [Desulfobacteraceae bacterium]